MNNLKLCLITPINNLSLSTYGNMYFALTRQLRDSKKYYNFFKHKKKCNFDVIVDNNVHEGTEVDFEDHVRLAKEVGTILIVPDVLRNKKKTIEYFHYFMDRWYLELKNHNIKIMAVPQGNNLEEINECFEVFNKDKRVDIIGHSFDLTPFKLSNSKYQNQSLNRLLVVTKWCKRTKKKIHLLGSNNLWELYTLSKFPQVYSTDGKFFSRISLANKQLDISNWKKIEKDKNIKMDFNKGFTQTNSKNFIKNVIFFREVLHDKHL